MPRSNWATPEDMDRLFGDTGRPSEAGRGPVVREGQDRPKQRRQQPERYFTDRIKRYARRGGWLPYHNLHAQGSDPGFLDLTLIRVPRLVVAELKVPPNTRPSDWQEVWLEHWRTLAMLSGPHLSIEVYVWTPEDEAQILEILK